jgi:hypothetical protein
MYSIKGEKFTENTLQSVMSASVGNEETLNEFPFIILCFEKLEAAVQPKKVTASSAISGRKVTLNNTMMHRFAPKYK